MNNITRSGNQHFSSLQFRWYWSYRLR